MASILASVDRKSSPDDAKAAPITSLRFKQWMASFDRPRKSQVIPSLKAIYRSKDNRSTDFHAINVSRAPSIKSTHNNLPPISPSQLSFGRLKQTYYLPIEIKPSRLLTEKSTDSHTSINIRANNSHMHYSGDNAFRSKAKTRPSVKDRQDVGRQTRAGVYISGGLGSGSSLFAKYKHLSSLKR